MNYITDYNSRIAKDLNQQDVIETIVQFYNRLKTKQDELQHIKIDSFFNQHHIVKNDEANKQFISQLMSKYSQEYTDSKQFNNFQVMYPFELNGTILYNNICRKIELYNNDVVLDSIKSENYQCFIEEHKSVISSYKIKLYFRNIQPFNLLILKNFVPLNLKIDSVYFRNTNSDMVKCTAVEEYVQNGITQLQFDTDYNTDYIELLTKKNQFIPSDNNEKKLVLQNSFVFNQKVQQVKIPTNYRKVIAYDPFYNVRGDFKISDNELYISNDIGKHIPILHVSCVLGDKND